MNATLVKFNKYLPFQKFALEKGTSHIHVLWYFLWFYKHTYDLQLTSLFWYLRGRVIVRNFVLPANKKHRFWGCWIFSFNSILFFCFNRWVWGLRWFWLVDFVLIPNCSFTWKIIMKNRYCWNGLKKFNNKYFW